MLKFLKKVNYSILNTFTWMISIAPFILALLPELIGCHYFKVDTTFLNITGITFMSIFFLIPPLNLLTLVLTTISLFNAGFKMNISYRVLKIVLLLIQYPIGIYTVISIGSCE